MNNRFRLLLVLLAVFGAFVGIVYTNPDGKTANVTFTYHKATEREDGTPLSLEEIKYTRLFCDGKQVAQEVGADGEPCVEVAAVPGRVEPGAGHQRRMCQAVVALPLDVGEGVEQPGVGEPWDLG